MAQRVQVLLVCDMHDGESEAAETVSFSVDGSSYEIDLCTKHADELRDSFAPFVGSARRASGGRGRGRRRGNAAKTEGRGNEIREWARQHGIAVSERGRISANVIAKYDDAHR